MISSGADVLGLDFGTTNSVASLVRADSVPDLVEFSNNGEGNAVFRSALCFWHDEDVKGGLAVEAGPWAISEYLEYPQESRFIQSFKSVAASANFEHASVFDKRFKFEDLGRIFLDKLIAHAGSRLSSIPTRLIVGRPVEYAGSRPDHGLARQRYDMMFGHLGADIHYVYEPLGAAFSYASRLTHPATILVADFGGGTSDFSVVRVAAPGEARRCVPLGHAGIGIAGDRFDYRIIDRLVLPMLGKGSSYRSFDKILEIPRSYFADFADWSRLALMRNRRTMEELARLQKNAVDPSAIGRMIAVIENELGYPLYEAVGLLKRTLSNKDSAHFHFSGAGLEVEADVSRQDFETWIAQDIASIEATVDKAMANAGSDMHDIDRVFLTGGSSLIPAIRDIFIRRFGSDRIASGGELTSISDGLARIGLEPNIEEWAV